ncbi:carboxypeptidase regulatory-like domain-containing protein [Bacteroidota bacterium]
MKTLKLISCIILTTILSMATITAQKHTPLPPKNFEVSIEEVNAGFAVKMTWTRNEEGIMPDIYNLYSTYGDEEKLELVGRVKNEPDKEDYSFYVHQLHPGIYHFFIRAAVHTSNGTLLESERTEIVTIEIKSGKKLRIVSEPNTVVKHEEKYVYELKAMSEINCAFRFELMEHPEGMHLQENTIYWAPEKPGEYKVAVRVFFIDCDEKAEDIQQFTIRVTQNGENELFVRIINLEENIHLTVGELVVYRLKCETNPDCSPVIFEFLGELPEGFEYNETGMFRFEARHEGKYEFTVKASLESHPDIHDLRIFVIIVGEGHEEPKFCAYINGSILFDDNTPVMEGMVSAWKLDREDNNERPYFHGKINQGQYEINVPEGNYALDITGEGFYPEWFEDAEFVTEATRIYVECEQEKVINGLVTKLPEPVKYTVSGKVYDAENNEPVYAMVEFIPVEFIFEEGKENENYRFVAKTDEEGNYSIELFDRHVYIARAVSMMNSKQYNVLYYENASNPMEADLIELTEDLSDINFAMVKPQEINAGFTGMVKNKDGEALRAKVIAYCIETYYEYFAEVQTVYTIETNEEGYFTFDHLVPGDYVVLSIPINRDYVPGYYKLNDFAVLKWKDATIIGVDEGMIDMIFEIMHRERGELGLAQIGGKIVSGSGSIGKAGDKLQTGIPVAGAFVYVIETNGSVSDYGFSNSEGQFDLDEVAVGTQKLVADKVGFDSYENYLETDYNENANVQIEFSMSEAVVDVKESGNNIFDTEIYPVPSDKFITVKFVSSEQARSELTIFNTLGNNILNLSIDVTKGTNLSKLNVSELAPGAYHLRIKIGETIQTKAFQIIR